MKVVQYTNYINFNPDWFDSTVEKVFFVENFDDKYVRGFKWNYNNNNKVPARISMKKFLSEYIPKPEFL